MPNPKEIIEIKRDGKPLSATQIKDLTQMAISGKMTGAQIAAFLMAAYLQGLSDSETANLTVSMAESGKKFDFSESSKPVVDKHSTGGVGDKVSLIVAPILAECGAIVPMISGRGLGHTGGTVDKIESVPGMKSELDFEDLKKLALENGLFIASQSGEIAPADGIIYSVRDETATVASTELITASILSKKFAEGLGGLVMDMKVGSGAFMPDMQTAGVLADSIRRVAKEAGLPVRIIYSSMDIPLGRAVGNLPEVIEAYESLREPEKTDIALKTICERVAGAMLLSVNLAVDMNSALEKVRQVWNSGAALARFKKFISAQGGNLEAALELHGQSGSISIFAERSGYFHYPDAMEIAKIALRMRTGRISPDDEIDKEAGIRFSISHAGKIENGSEIARVFCQNKNLLEKAANRLSELIKIEDIKPSPSSWVFDEEMIII